MSAKIAFTAKMMILSRTISPIFQKIELSFKNTLAWKLLFCDLLLNILKSFGLEKEG
jgi:hypothetical protein